MHDYSLSKYDAIQTRVPRTSQVQKEYISTINQHFSNYRRVPITNSWITFWCLRAHRCRSLYTYVYKL